MKNAIKLQDIWKILRKFQENEKISKKNETVS